MFSACDYFEEDAKMSPAALGGELQGEKCSSSLCDTVLEDHEGAVKT
jgi:hypothetical protein